MKSDLNKFKNIFVGPDKYYIGMLFIFANLMGYFNHMRKIHFSDNYSIGILFGLTIIAKILA